METIRAIGYRQPKQGRSQRTLARILDAAELLLDGRDFSEVSVHDISAAAGTSVSSFYARFPDKNAMLHAVFERFAVEMHERVDAFEAQYRRRDATLGELIAGVIETYMDVWQGRRGLITTLTAAERTDKLLFERRQSLDAELALRFRDECLRVQPELEQRGFGRTFEIGLPSLAAAIRASVDRPDLFGGRSIHSREELVKELTELALGYLTKVDSNGERAEQGPR